MAAQAAGDARRPADQQHRRRDQLRHVRVRPAAARLRPRPARRAAGWSSAAPAPGETLTAINNKVYELTPGHARDRRRRAAGRPGGRDGGARDRDRPGTTDVLIEAAQFDAMSVRQDLAGPRPVQPVELPVRAAARPRGHRMGQPPLRRADPGSRPAGRSTRA